MHCVTRAMKDYYSALGTLFLGTYRYHAKESALEHVFAQDASQFV